MLVSGKMPRGEVIAICGKVSSGIGIGLVSLSGTGRGPMVIAISHLAQVGNLGCLVRTLDVLGSGKVSFFCCYVKSKSRRLSLEGLTGGRNLARRSMSFMNCRGGVPS